MRVFSLNLIVFCSLLFGFGGGMAKTSFAQEQAQAESEAVEKPEEEKSKYEVDTFFKRYLKPLPEVEVIAEDDFIDQTKRIQKKPNGDDVLEFSMRIPKDWNDDGAGGLASVFVNSNIFQDIATYYSKPSYNGRARVTVSAMNADTTLSIAQWYLNYLIEGGLTTEGLHIVNDNEIESFSIELIGNTTYTVRNYIIGNGDKILKISVYVPNALYEEFKQIQYSIVHSFKILNKTERPEPDLELYRFLDIAVVGFPKSWEAFAKPMRTTERLEVSLANIDRRGIEGSNGKTSESVSTLGKVDVILVSALSDTSILNEIDRYKVQLENQGILVGDKMADETGFEYNEKMSFSLTEIYEGVDTNSNASSYEFWFTVLVGGNYFYFVTIVTPSRNDNFATWAKNTQAYRIMLKNLEPVAGAFLIRN